MFRVFLGLGKFKLWGLGFRFRVVGLKFSFLRVGGLRFSFFWD